MWRAKDWNEDYSLRDGYTYGMLGFWRFRIFQLIYIFLALIKDSSYP
jgi:hypothetical protein